jgi:hypothetical protein
MEQEKEVDILEPDVIAQRIFIVRGQKVMLDSHLAELYQVDVKRLNEQVRRNSARFPIDFMFQLTKEEAQNLKSQIATSSSAHGGKRKPSFVFTEHGVAMLSSVLRSPRAIQMNIFIIRAFVKIRELLTTHSDLASKLEELEKEQREHSDQLEVISDALKRLMDSSEPARSDRF